MLTVCCTQRTQLLQLAVKMDGVFSCKLSCFAAEVSCKEDGVHLEGGRSKHLSVFKFTFSLLKEVRPVIATPVSSQYFSGEKKSKGWGCRMWRSVTQIRNPGPQAQLPAQPSLAGSPAAFLPHSQVPAAFIANQDLSKWLAPLAFSSITPQVQDS